MAFWLFMLFCCLLIPGTMLFFGRLWSRRPPKSINGAYGYRTARSMQNIETWTFAHQYCGRLWQWTGWVLLLLSAASLLLVWGQGIDRVGIAGFVISMTQCLILILTILPVERALRREFDEQGRRRPRS